MGGMEMIINGYIDASRLTNKLIGGRSATKLAISHNMHG